MLILGRRLGQKVIVDGGRMVIEVVGVRGGGVRLGFTAPLDVVIDREEIDERKRRERLARAAAARDGDGHAGEGRQPE